MSDQPQPALTFLQLRLPQTNESTYESMSSLLSNFTQGISIPFFDRILGKKPTLSALEIVLQNGQIYFYLVCPTRSLEFFRSQILAQYPNAITKDTTDPLPQTGLIYQQLTLSRSSSYPVKTSRDFRDVDPLNSILSPLSRNPNPSDFFLYQIILSPAPKNWQNNIISIIQNGIIVDASRNFRQPHPDKSVFETKIQYPGLTTQINLATNNPGLLSSFASSFGIYTQPRGNFFTTYQGNFLNRRQIKKSVQNRQYLSSIRHQILNTEEIAALWHLPNKNTKIPNIAWGQRLYSDPPETLPVASNIDPAQKQSIVFFAKTEFRNQETIYGIKEGEDRRRHTYIIGKSGTGKTTLIANMAIDDIRKGRGVAIIDPHGDLSQTMLDYIPSSRVNDCCYFNPADPEYVYPINVIESQSESQRELVASGVISIFKKLYGQTWGPRLEHIMRNTLLTLVHTQNTHLGNVIDLLTNSDYRKSIVSQLKEPTLKNFWLYEFEKMDQNFRSEATQPILNKVGQFVANRNIRNTICQTKSKVNIEEIMNQQKILIVDLSMGKLGEDSSSLLGAMIVTQIQIAAMNRVHQSVENRPDFYLYVDEFQNFATDAFIKILSEARKFHLNLIIANQYMNQLDRTIQDAILGNVGSMISFVVGNSDAYILSKEFGPTKFPPEDLIKLGRYQIVNKLSIDSETSEPFYATALPPLDCKNQGREKLIRISQERYGKKLT